MSKVHTHEVESSDWVSGLRHEARRMRENCACGAYRWVAQPSFKHGVDKEGPVTPWIGGIAVRRAK